MNEIERRILSSIKDGRNVGHVDWATNTDELLAAYQNGSEWHGIIKKYLESLYGNSINKEHVVKHIMLPDIVRYIVKELSTVHEKPAVRTLIDPRGKPVKEDTEHFEIWRKMLKACDYDNITAQAEQWANLLNCCVIYAAPDFRHNTFRLWLVEAPELRVFQDPTFPNDFNRCSHIAVRMASNTDSTEARINRQKWWIFRREEPNSTSSVDRIVSWEADENFDPMPNQPKEFKKYRELDRFPMTLIQPQSSRRGMLFRDIPQDLLTLAKKVDGRLTSKQYTIHFKEFEPYVTSTRKEEFTEGNAPNPGGTPASIIMGANDLHTVDWQPKTQEYMDDLRGTIRIFAQSRGLNLSFLEKILAPESGIAKFYDDKPRRERRQDVIPYYEDIENNDLFPKILQMAQMVGFPGAAKLEGYTQLSSFPDLDSELSPQEQQLMDEKNILLGLTSAVEVRAKRDGTSLDVAREKLAEIGAKVATARQAPTGSG